MKINIGIVGYGNLGKAVEKTVLANKDFNLVAIFSRRTVVSSFNTTVEPYENFKEYSSKIDVMMLCGGSKSDLEIQTPEVLEYFDCINTFDTHAKITSEYEKLGELAKNTNHRLIMSCGWDPGIFSIIRAMFKSISGNEPITFWGKGVSMGHSDAIRRVKGVIDGVQFTVPNKEAIKLAKQGSLSQDIPLHFRECYVVSKKEDEKSVEEQIKKIPNYFKGQPTTVNFVSQTQLQKLKEKLYHKGEVIESFSNACGSKFQMSFAVSMDSNPEFTASIMSAYIYAICNLKENSMTGNFTNLDIPVSYLFKSSDKKSLLSLC